MMKVKKIKFTETLEISQKQLPGHRYSRHNTTTFTGGLNYTDTVDIIRNNGRPKVNQATAIKLKKSSKKSNVKKRVRSRSVAGGAVIPSRYTSGDPQCCRRRRRRRAPKRVINIYVDIVAPHYTSAADMRKRGEKVLETAKHARMNGDIVKLHILCGLEYGRGRSAKQRIFDIEIGSKNTSAVMIALAEPGYFRNIIFGVLEHEFKDPKAAGKTHGCKGVQEYVKKNDGILFPSFYKDNPDKPINF